MWVPTPSAAPYLRFSESINISRTQILKGLIHKSNQPGNTFDEYHVTVRLQFGKCDGLKPELPPPTGSRIDIFLGDDKHNPSLCGQATVISCKKTLWGYFGQTYPTALKSLFKKMGKGVNSSIFAPFGGKLPNIDPDFYNNLDGNSRSEIEHYLNIFYAKYSPALTPVKRDSEVSVFYLAF